MRASESSMLALLRTYGTGMHRPGVLVLLLAFQIVEALENGVGRTPPMGYNTWNDVQAKVSDAIVRDRADALVSSGLAKLGYEYLIIDDGWATRNSTTMKLEGDPATFPHGMASVAAFVHSKDLKFGLYTDRGTKTCAGRPGSLGFEGSDASTFAEFGVDYLKEDNCHAPGGPSDRAKALAEFGKMRDALNSTGRPIFFAVCGGGGEIPFASNISWYAVPPFGKELANSWRISADVGAPFGLSWDTARASMAFDSVLGRFAGPGGWNDADMLLTSNTKAKRFLSPAQSRTQFSVWAVLAAPLLIGGPISNLSTWDFETYSNTEVIQVNQDALGEQGMPLVYEQPLGSHSIWGRRLSNGGMAFVFVNCHARAHNVTCDESCWARTPFENGTVLAVRDLWTHDAANESFVRVPEAYSVRLGGDGASCMLSFTPQ